MTGKHRYRLEIVFVGPTTTERSTRALRALLKSLLRSFGFRCTLVEPIGDNTDGGRPSEPAHKRRERAATDGPTQRARA